MFEPNLTMEQANRFSRFDESHPLSTVSPHGFELESQYWPTAEHYYQTHKYEGLPLAEKILAANSGGDAHTLGNQWFKRKVKGWKKNRQVWMTRALYRKTLEYSDIKDALMATGDDLLIETSLYDHFWGIGRDQRGENMLGKIWMDIRSKIQADTQQTSES